MKELLAFALGVTLITGVAFSQGNGLPEIKLTRFKLTNGLTVVLHEDHATPVVSVTLLYKVGSKDEAAGKTGLAHLFEHLMFMGSKNHNYRSGPAQELASGVAGGYTTRDKTVYHTVVPSNYLERVLYLEGDRMGGLVDVMDQSKLDFQRDVVRNERRQFMDNVPFGTMAERTNAMVFPKGHPYHHDIIGSMDDLAAASVEDVNSFFRQYYVPNNAVLALSGDFEPAEARAWIQQYFGRIGSGNTVSRPAPTEVRLAGTSRSMYEDRFAKEQRLAIAWAMPHAYSRDEAALVILADILTYGRGSRLNDSLVHKNQLASEVAGRIFTGELGGSFQITANVRTGRSLDEIEREIDKEIERIKRDGVSPAEVERYIAIDESSRLNSLQTARGKGELIAQYAAFAGTPDYFREDLERFRRVTAPDIKRVANRYLNADRVILRAIPAKGSQAPMRSDPPTNTGLREIDPALRAKQEAMLPKPGPEPKFNLPPVEKARLSNGLNVWIVPRRTVAVVAMNLVVNAGASLDDRDREGLAAMTSLMIPNGTVSRSATEISDGLQSIGAFFNSDNAGWDTNWLWMQSTKKNLDRALGYYADIIKHASFPEEEFRTQKERSLEELGRARTNSAMVAARVLDKVLYGNQLYGRQPGGTEKSVGAITADDVRRFYSNYYRPNNATLIVVGDIQRSDIVARLEKAFSDWKPGDITADTTVVRVSEPKPGIYLIDRPGTVQSAITIGQAGVDRSTPDFAALQVMNAILSQRLARNIRQEKGFAYRVSSSFSFRKGPGPFSASAEVQSVSTGAAVQEFLNELNGIRGGRRITATELTGRKQSLIHALPRDFETVGGISVRLAEPAAYGLAADYFNEFIPNIAAVTAEDAQRVANKYLDPSKMSIVIVGDRKMIEGQLKELGMPIFIVDADGNAIER